MGRHYEYMDAISIRLTPQLDSSSDNFKRIGIGPSKCGVLSPLYLFY